MDERLFQSKLRKTFWSLDISSCTSGPSQEKINEINIANIEFLPCTVDWAANENVERIVVEKRKNFKMTFVL